MEPRPLPAEAARRLLGGRVASPSFLAHSRALTTIARPRQGRLVLADLRCACGGLVVVVVREPLGDLLLTSISEGGKHAVQALWLDEAEHIPAARCHCGSMMQGARRHVTELRGDVARAASAGVRVSGPMDASRADRRLATPDMRRVAAR